MNVQAPEYFVVDFETNIGVFSIEVHRHWAPIGVDRFYNLVVHHFYDSSRFYRVLPNWIVQWGINGDPEISKVWDYTNNEPGVILKNDPVLVSNVRGTIAFSCSYNDVTQVSANRTTEVYVNYQNNTILDRLGYAPFGRVISGMNVLEALYFGYGEVAEGICPNKNSPSAKGTCLGPSETLIYEKGNQYLDEEFPLLDYVVSGTLRPASLHPSTSPLSHTQPSTSQSTRSKGASFFGYLLIIFALIMAVGAIYVLLKKYAHLWKSQGGYMPLLSRHKGREETDAVDLDFR